MRRIYFMVPDKKTTQKIVDEIRDLNIGDRFIHVLAKRGTPLNNMPEKFCCVLILFTHAITPIEYDSSNQLFY